MLVNLLYKRTANSVCNASSLDISSLEKDSENKVKEVKKLLNEEILSLQKKLHLSRNIQNEKDADILKMKKEYEILQNAPLKKIPSIHANATKREAKLLRLSLIHF